MKNLTKAIIVCMLLTVIAGTVGCCCMTASPDATTQPTAKASTNAGAPTAKPTVTLMPTATPKPLTGLALYKTWDKAKVESEAQGVNWEDFIRYPDNYKGKLIKLKGDVVFGNEDWRGSSYFTMNVNPNFFKDSDYKGSYTPQYVQFNYNTEGIIDGDEIMMYGVYDGEKTFTDYPEIDGVQCTLYT